MLQPDAHSVKACLPPVVSAATRVLVLGSLPGDASLGAAQYYAHPQNAFWRLLGTTIGVDLAALPYPERLAAIGRQGIGLWDTVARARRPGSLDGAMRGTERNDLAALVTTLPALRAIGFNGKTAQRLGRAALGPTALTLIDLPSSSPAYTLGFSEKLIAWRRLADFTPADAAIS